jgi:hypothetical protein
MRKTGLCLALVASAQLTLFSFPAFAQDRPAPPTGQTSSDAPAAPVAATGTVNVHIKSDAPVTLEHRATPSAAWETSCSSPCDVAVPVGDEFQVSGDGLNPSKPFHLDASKGKVSLDVSVGRKSSQKVGTGVAIAGAAFGVAGILVIALGAKPSSTFNAQGTTSTAHTNDLFIGGALLLGGAIAAIYGGAMIVNNGNSSVNGDVGKPPPVYGVVDDAPSKVAQNPVPNVPTFVAPVLHFNF